MMRRMLLLAGILFSTMLAAQPSGSLRSQMKELAVQFDMLFVYDASLPVDQPASAAVEPGLNLRQNLRTIFRGTGITWAVRRNYVVLTAERQLGMKDSPHTEMLVLSQYDTLSAAFKIDTLPPSVKTALRRDFDQLPGTFTTDPKALAGKVLSPVGENDPIKFAMTRPGVSSGAEGFSAFFARGGNLGNNLFTLDGVRIYGPGHLMGLTTAVPGEAIETMDFRIGGFSGETGGLTASHVALHSPAFDQRTLNATASVSNTFLGASVRAPLVKDKASVLVAGRWSPFGLEYGLLKKGLDRDGRMPSLKLGVWDAYLKSQWHIAPRHELTLSCFGSRDAYTIGFPSADYTLGWENAMGHLSYRFKLTATTIRADVSYSHFRNRMEHAAVLRGDKNLLLLQSHIESQNYGVTAEHRFFEGHFWLSEGLSHQRDVMSPAAMKISESDVKVIDDAPFTESKSRPTLSSGFLEMQFNIGPVNLMANVRGNYYKNHAERESDRLEQFAWEFSARAKWQIIRGLGLEATWDDRTQFDHTLEGTPLGWSLDLMVPSTKLLLPERAKQGYGGLFASFGGHAVTLGGYYKKMENLVYYTDAMALFTSAAQGWSDHAEVGSGTSYGVEILYEARLPETGATWSLAYTWSKTDRTFPNIDEGSPFPARYDRRHILNAHAQWKGFNAGFTLQGGHWETVPAAQYPGYLPGEEVVLNYFTHPNNWQMPLYVRLDLGYRFEFTTGRDRMHPLSHSLTLGVFNVLNRHNPSLLAYDSDTRTWSQISLFPIMPSIKYTLEL